MRRIGKNKFETLNEWIARAGLQTSPAAFRLLNYSRTIDGETVSFNAWALFVLRYGDRYIAESCDLEADPYGMNFNTRLTMEANAVFAYMKDKIDGVDRMLSDMYADGETETLEYKRAPNGAADFDGAYSDGGTKRQRSGASSGNIDRIIRAENELVSMWDQLMERFEFLFISVRTPWGEEVEE